MGLYLIVSTESDYEMFHENNEASMKALERRIREANSADEAIIDYCKWNESEVTSEGLERYFALEVAKKKCETISKIVLDAEVAHEEREKEKKMNAVELAELERLQRKYVK